MSYDEFIALDAPATELSPYLLALWHEKRGDWNRAHEIVQDIETHEASAIHAYLHRREGDLSNAQYWYSQARRPARLDMSMDEEWETLVQEMLSL